jgi:hypothetical protein
MHCCHTCISFLQERKDKWEALAVHSSLLQHVPRCSMLAYRARLFNKICASARASKSFLQSLPSSTTNFPFPTDLPAHDICLTTSENALDILRGCITCLFSLFSTVDLPSFQRHLTWYSTKNFLGIEPSTIYSNLGHPLLTHTSRDLSHTLPWF